MISDSGLMKLSFVIAVVGTISLFFIVQLIEPSFVSISEINEVMDGQVVITEGVVSSFSTAEGHVFLTLSDSSGAIKVVIFENQAEDDDYELKNGDKISVEGRISIYRNELEIIAENIEKI